MQESEQRITALLNGEIQIAQYVPPYMMKRLEGNPKITLRATDAVEIMFLAMNPKFKPWDNKTLRRAVAYAIDRKSIIESILGGLATPLHGPIGPGQYGYDAARAKTFDIPYDPEKAKALVREAGYPNGVDVDLFTATGRYVNDKQVAEAISAMLTKVGIRVRLHTPEYGTYWPEVQKGRVPFFYQGRGSMIDPSVGIAQYFETGVTPRIGYSNPALDKLLRAERSEFDPQKRKALLNDAFAILMDDVPAVFLWRHRLVEAMAKTVDHRPMPHNRIYGDMIAVHSP
jgi:peptide/nickel transport system substrate-binding protein